MEAIVAPAAYHMVWGRAGGFFTAGQFPSLSLTAGCGPLGWPNDSNVVRKSPESETFPVTASTSTHSDNILLAGIPTYFFRVTT